MLTWARTGGGAPLAPERAFLGLGWVAGLVFLFLTPPMQVPDEPAHLYRAYQVSEGRILGERLGAESGGLLPRSLQASARALDPGVSFHPERRVDPAAVLAELRRALRPEERAFVAFPGSVVYSPVPYVPQAVAIAAGRRFGASPLVLVYLGRLANLAAALVLAWLAIRLTPILKSAFLLFALMPMVVFQRSSLSADACTHALALLVVAMALDMAFGPEGVIRPARKALFAGLACCLALSKPLYLPIPFLVLMASPERLGGRRRALALFGVLLALTLGSAVCWAYAVRGVYTPYWGGCDPLRQLGHLASHPLAVLRIAHDVLADLPRLLLGMVGILGWLDTRLPVALRAGTLVALVLAAACESDPRVRLSVRERLLAAALCAGNCLMIPVLMYLIASPVGADSLRGLQARYFIPVVPLALLLLYRHRPIPPWVDRLRTGACAVFALGALAITAAVLVRRYYP